MLRGVVAEHGSVLVRGLGVCDPATFAAVAQQLANGLMSETEAFAPRHPHGAGVYSSTPWPANQPMCMHHELSYALEVPGLLLFACVTPATTGGATPLADASAVLDALPAELVGRFERDGWLLTRSYNDEIGATVAEAFGTDDRGAVEQYCRANAIDLEWQPDGALRTRQRRRAVVRHPLTGRRCWFNQIAFLNEWTIAPEVRDYLVDSTGPTGCRSTPASATATRSARTSSSCSTTSTRPTPCASPGRPATSWWSTTSAPPTAASPTTDHARCSSR